MCPSLVCFFIGIATEKNLSAPGTRCAGCQVRHEGRRVVIIPGDGAGRKSVSALQREDYLYRGAVIYKYPSYTVSNVSVLSCHCEGAQRLKQSVRQRQQSVSGTLFSLRTRLEIAALAPVEWLRLHSVYSTGQEDSLAMTGDENGGPEFQ